MDWSKLTPEKKAEINAKRRAKYALVPESERIALNKARRAKDREAWANKDFSEKAKRQRQMRDYSLQYKKDWLTHICSLPKEEALDAFCKSYYRKFKAMYDWIMTNEPFVKPDRHTAIGKQRAIECFNNWGYTRDYIWDWWLSTYNNKRGPKTLLRRTDRMDRPGGVWIPTPMFKQWLINCSRYELWWRVRKMEIWLTLYRWGWYKTRPEVERIQLTEAWQMILLKLGRKCVKCNELVVDYMWRLILKEGEDFPRFHVIPHTLHSLQAVLKDDLSRYELWCFRCHADYRLKNSNWIRDLTPEQVEQVREKRPKWMHTEEIRDGKRWEVHYLRRTDSHNYWRNQPRDCNWTIAIQGIYLYKNLYPTANTENWGPDWKDYGLEYTHRHRAVLSKEFREFLRLNPPPGSTPLNSEQADAIYLKIFSKIGAILPVCGY